MSKLDDLLREIAHKPQLSPEQVSAKRAEWEQLGGLAMEYPELASPHEYQRYARDPQAWLQSRRRTQDATREYLRQRGLDINDTDIV